MLRVRAEIQKVLARDFSKPVLPPPGGSSGSSGGRLLGDLEEGDGLADTLLPLVEGVEGQVHSSGHARQEGGGGGGRGQPPKQRYA